MTIQPNWTVLENAIGFDRCDRFMYMGETSNGIKMYKHIETRRYINIGPDGATYQYDAKTNGYVAISEGAAIEWAFS